MLRGRLLRLDARRRDAIVSQSYAQRNGVSVGGHVTVAGKSFKVIGISKAPLGARPLTSTFPLAQLQKLSKREGRINVLQVRATSGDRVEPVAMRIRSDFSGAQVTTAKNLADRVSGSLVDARTCPASSAPRSRSWRWSLRS